MTARTWLLFGGLLCIAAGLFNFGQIWFFYAHSDRAAEDLLARTEAIVSRAAQDRPVDAPPPTAPPVSPSSEPHLLGELHIPPLSLRAPIVRGTEAEQLEAAVGHHPSSALPGTSGTSLLAAHNATWFRHLDDLRRGDRFHVATAAGTFTYQVAEARIVHIQDGVPEYDGPALVLESCYPLDALTRTDYRYLVYSRLVTE